MFLLLVGARTVQPEEAVGLVLRELRLASGLSQEKLAFEAGVERNYVSLLERGQNSASVKMLFKLAKALGVTVSFVIVKAETLLAAETGQGT